MVDEDDELQAAIDAGLRAHRAIKIVRELFGEEDPMTLRPTDIAERVVAHIRKVPDAEAVDVLCIIMYMQFQDGHVQACGRPFDITKSKRGHGNVH